MLSAKGAKGGHCATCQGHRLHLVRIRRDPDSGHTTRVRICIVCETVGPIPPVEQPGICCRKCGDVRFEAVFTRAKSPGLMIRVKQCHHCGHRIRVSEKVVSYAA